MAPDRIERLVTQVLEETRAFRQETNEKFVQVNERLDRLEKDVSGLKAEVSGLKADVSGLKVDVGLVKLAIIEHSREIRDLRGEVQRIGVRLDDHEARIVKLEGAAE